MSDINTNQKVIEAIERVEHPSIATTLLDLGMLRDIEVSSDKKVALTMVLPFPSIPDNVRDYMVNSLATAIQSSGGELVTVNLAVMNEEERQNFLTIEQQNWRG
ncbi:MAG: iron-sulfur cluster assembly protein [Chloroflexota bacterium]|nr:iron-sulfur cluster assembly protein [Chloroflexota bacterium]